MQEKRWIDHLTTIGLTENEAAVYLTALKEGPSPVQTLAKASDLSRVTVYTIIESLKRFGLMTHVEKGKRTYYAAEPAERLLTFAEERTQHMKSVVKEMKGAVNELKLIESGDKPVVKLFEGEEALKALQTDILESGAKELFEFGNLDAIVEKVPQHAALYNFYEQLDSRKVQRYMIFSAKTVEPKQRSEHEHILTLPDGDPFQGDVMIYDNKISLSEFTSQHIVILVESEVLANTLREMFFTLFRQLK